MMSKQNIALELSKNNSLSLLRNQFSKLLLFVFIANAAIISALSVFFNNNILINIAFCGVITAVAITSLLKDRTAPLTRYITAASLAGQIAIIVNVFAGTGFQIDTHMYFFAMLALLAGWCDWRAIVTYSAVVAVHHLSLNFAFPAAVFPDGSDFSRVILHAVILIIESAFLIWLTYCLSEAMNKADNASQEADSLAQASQQKNDDMQELLVSLKNRETQMNELISHYKMQVTEAYSDVELTTKQLDDMSNELSNIAQNSSGEMAIASSSTSKTSENVNSVATASEELSQSVDEIARQSEDAKDAVSQGTRAVNGTSSLVGELATSAQKIGEVISLVQEIAEQTNLLALNATIEAARAGEMGKGFAVVASEVKTLASQTAKATDDISTQVANIQTSTSSAVDEIDNIVKLMEGVDKITASISSAIEQQGGATTEISYNAQETASITETLNTNIETVRSGVDQTLTIATSVRDISGKVVDANMRMSDLTAKFLSNIEVINKNEAA